MKKRYLIAADFDDTLAKDGEVSERNKKAIDKFRATGNVFGVNTGRSRNSSFDIMTKCGGKGSIDFIICGTGSVILDSQLNLIKKYETDIFDFAPLMNILIENNTKYMTSYNYDEGYSVPLGWNEEFRQYIGQKRDWDITWLSEEDFAVRALPFTDLHLGYDPPEKAQEMARMINRDYSDHLSAYTVEGCLDVIPKGINKAEGIRNYVSLTGLDDCEIYAAGDGRNDVIMIEAFHGVAMRNGVKEAKDAAEIIVGDIAELIEMLMKEE